MQKSCVWCYVAAHPVVKPDAGVCHRTVKACSARPEGSIPTLLLCAGCEKVITQLDGQGRSEAAERYLHPTRSCSRQQQRGAVDEKYVIKVSVPGPDGASMDVSTDDVVMTGAFAKAQRPV
jgi:hypothetical protein